MSRVILVLGLRSGASVLAHMLEVFGISLGDKLSPVEGTNPSDFEDSEIVELNGSILRYFNSTWHSLNSISPQNLLTMPGAFHERAVGILNDRLARDETVAFKDPRFCRLMPFW
jgi:hypothetical protein